MGFAASDPTGGEGKRETVHPGPSSLPFPTGLGAWGETVMAEDDALRQDLLWRIEARRASIQAYLRENRPRTRRRASITIVLSSLAALFTAGPALGGEPFAESVQNALGLARRCCRWRGPGRSAPTRRTARHPARDRP